MHSPPSSWYGQRCCWEPQCSAVGGMSSAALRSECSRGRQQYQRPDGRLVANPREFLSPACPRYPVSMDRSSSDGSGDRFSLDVVVVGAGPTGLACGIDVKRAGLTVANIDK